MFSEMPDLLRHSAKSVRAMYFSSFIKLLLKIKAIQFSLFFVSILRMTNLFFAFKNMNCCYLYRFYYERALRLIDWLSVILICSSILIGSLK